MLFAMKISFVLLSVVACGHVCCQQPAGISPRVNGDTAYVYREPSSGGTGKFYFGREIAHVMDASGADWLERPQRPRQENTDLIVENMHLQPGDVVADVGAGTGYYTFRIARLVSQGKVYAVEIQDELIRKLKKKTDDEKVSNVEVIRGDTLSVNLPDRSIDLAVMVDVYHELSWPREILRSISKSLKPGGRLLLIEYRGEDPEVRIKRLHKTTVAQLERELSASGFALERRVDKFPIQHFLLFKKQ